MKQTKNSAGLVIVIGAIMLIVGIVLPNPSKLLDTKPYDEKYEESGYSYIDEYVGGDAYNYIIGASLVGGEISGTIAMKAALSAAGVIVICIGIIAIGISTDLQNKKKNDDIRNQTMISAESYVEAEKISDISNSSESNSK